MSEPITPAIVYTNEVQIIGPATASYALDGCHCGVRCEHSDEREDHDDRP